MHLHHVRPRAGALLSAPLFVLAGCGSQSEEAQETGPGASTGIQLQDGAGTEIALDGPAQRVVCLDGSCVDALAELGLAPVAAQPIDTARHTGFFGPDAGVEPIGGSYFEPNVEEIVAAEPDLVIGSAAVHGGLRKALGEIPLYGQSFTTEQAPDNLMAIAELTGLESTGEQAVQRWQETMDGYGPGERDVSVLSMYGGATQDIGIDALDSQIGGVLADYTAYPWPEAGEGDSGFLELSLEQVLEVDPEHIWVLDFGFDPDAPPLVESLAEDPVWGELTAVRSEQVHQADSAWWGTASGTRAQQLLLDEVMTTVYPEQFPEPLSGLGQG